MKSILLLLTALLSCPFYLMGQLRGTSEWIDPSASYFQLKVYEDGIYRVTFTDMKLAGLNLDNKDHSGIKLLKNGKEIPIRVTADYIEFPGFKNGGELDLPFYKNPNDQAHQEFSLYSDTSIYWLYYDEGAQGLRYQKYTNQPSLARDTLAYHNKTVLKTYQERYHDGVRDIGPLFHPNMAAGEGWGTDWIRRAGSSFLYEDFNLSDAIDTFSALLELYVVGITDKGGSNLVDNINHHALVEYKKAGNWNLLLEEYFRGRVIRLMKKRIDDSWLENETFSFRVQNSSLYNGSPVLNGILALKYAKIEYKARFSFDGEESATFSFDKPAVNSLIIADGFGGTNALVYDLKNNKFTSVSANQGELKLLVQANAVNPELLISHDKNVTYLAPRPHRIKNVSIDKANDFIIITHKKHATAVAEYEQYKESEAGGNHNVGVYYVDELYDQYYYGYHHSLAIKSFIIHLVDENVDVQNVFFIGKGRQISALRQGNGRIPDYSDDLVPTIGSPSSDWYFGSYLKPGEPTPSFGIGRLSVTTNAEIRNYLEKIKNYRGLRDASWRKEVVHVGGGKTQDEARRFRNYMQRLENIIEGPKYGANVTYFGKDDPLAISEDLTEKLINNVNKGVGFVSYFGHASASETEVDYGEPEDYSNLSRPTMMYFAGCILGNCYEEDPVLGEKFISAKNGVVNWIAAGTVSFEGTVLSYSESLYDQLSLFSYGESIGKIMAATMKEFFVAGNQINETQNWMTILQGDPSISLYSPQEPDLSVLNSSIFVGPDDKTAQTDTLILNVIVKNEAMVMEDSFHISYKLRYPNGKTSTGKYQFPPLRNLDTFSISVPNTEFLFGEHKVDIVLDPDNEIVELNEDNNSASHNFTLLSNGAFGLFPGEYSIVPDNKLELVAQSIDLEAKNNLFIFELDTTPYFNSKWRKRSSDISGDLLGRWEVNLLGNDTQAYYWRVRMKLNSGKLSPWSEKSFTHIKNSRPGWAQVEFNQHKSALAENIYADTTARIFRFVRFTAPGQFIISNHGRDYPQKDNYVFGNAVSRDDKIIRKNNYFPVNRRPTYNGMVAYAIDPNMNDADLFDPFIIDNGVANTNGLYEFNWIGSSPNQIIPSVLDSFVSYLNQIPKGYHLFLYSGYYHRLADMPDRVYRAIEAFGSIQVRKLTNNSVYVFIGTKGIKPGQAMAETHTNRQDTLLISSATFNVTRSEGSLKSSLIGPSRKWRDIVLSAEAGDQANESLNYRLYGLNRLGEKFLLIKTIIPGKHDISFINSDQYPYLQIEQQNADGINYTPRNPSRWIVHYDYLPEGLINTQHAFSFQSDTLERGTPVKIEIGYQNVSNLSLDSLEVHYEIYDDNRRLRYFERETRAPVAPGQFMIIEKQFPTDSLRGDNRLVIRTNPNRAQPEMYAFNNNYERTFHVRGDHLKPVLEVTFDGKRIFNGDVISRTPEIVLKGTDNSGFFPLNKPHYFQLKLYPEDSLTGDLFDYSEEGINFIPATTNNNTAFLEYRPVLSEDTYVLEAQLIDASGNKAGESPYIVRFEVKAANELSSFSAFPNPFYNQVDFVFNLSGDSLPEAIEIEIFNSSGQFVRKLEIGNSAKSQLKPGINLDTYSWNGTDASGNPLPKGIYFFKVYTLYQGERQPFRPSNRNFSTKNFGKLILLRP